MKKIILKYLNRFYPMNEEGYRLINHGLFDSDIKIVIVFRLKEVFGESIAYRRIVNEWVETFNGYFYYKNKYNVKMWVANSNSNYLHRLNGPAMIHPDGSEYWYQNGVYHREGGPAVLESNGNEEWFINGKRHRLGGPALITSNNNKYWFKNDDVHREDGPAIIYSNGSKQWWLYGSMVSEEVILNKIK